MPPLCPACFPHHFLFLLLCTWIFFCYLPFCVGGSLQESLITERTSELDPVLEPCSGMENGCEWRFRLPVLESGGF